MTEPHRPKERRLHPRYSVETPIEILGGRHGPALLKDVSVSGLSCLSPQAFEEMSVLEVNMTLPHPDGPRPFHCGGAVVRCDVEPDGRHLVAIFFTQMDEANLRTLQDFLATQQA